MSVTLSDQEIEGLRQKTTDELLAIWQANDRSKWSGPEFDAISDVLFERGIVAPLQEGHFTAESSLTGVRGWLLFFCLILVVINPLVNFVAFIDLKEIQADPNASRVVLIFLFAVCGFGVLAGVELWRVAPGAVNKAKAFLWTFLIVQVGGGIALISMSDEATVKDAADVLRSVVFFGVWYLYLKLSKRVKNTYGG